MNFDRPITIALILFAVLILAFFFVAPQYSNMQTLEINLAQKKAEYNAKFEYFSEVTAAYDEIQQNKNAVQKIDDALPAKPEFGQLVYYFQTEAHNNGLILKNLSLSQSATGTDVKNTVFSLDMTGDYPSLENFIISLEGSARIFEFTNISFGSAQKVSTPSTAQTSSQSTANQFQSTGMFNFNLQVATHSY